MAEAMAGRNEEAWRHLKTVLPSSYNEKAQIRKVEPYAVCQSTNSKFSGTPGTGNLPWLSGSAVWNYFAITNVILGIKPHYDGLEINPCIPSSWNGFRARRKFRDCEFHIEVSRTTRLEKKSLLLNGRNMEGAIIPACQFKKKNKVKLAIHTPLSG
jgi:cellobiose phosphorylase